MVTIDAPSSRASRTRRLSTWSPSPPLGAPHREPAVGGLLHLLDDLQPPPAAGALERIGGIGDMLELIEHEVRDDDRPRQELGPHHLDQPPVDDRRRVDHAGLCRTRADPDQAQDVDVLAGGDAREHVGDQQDDRQQQVRADDRQLRDGDPRQRRGDQPEHQPQRPDGQLGRRAPVGGAVDGAQVSAQPAPGDPAQQVPDKGTDDHDGDPQWRTSTASRRVRSPRQLLPP